jgi:transcriptional regulator with XRE-family HTH domain
LSREIQEVHAGQAVQALLVDLGLTMRDLEIILDTTARHIGRWARDEAYPQTKSRQRLAELMTFHEHLDAMFTAWEGAADWLNTPSRYLASLTPLEAMRAGRTDRAREALLALSAGVYL